MSLAEVSVVLRAGCSMLSRPPENSTAMSAQMAAACQWPSKRYGLCRMYLRFRLIANALRPISRKPMMMRPNALARLSRKK